MAKGKESTIHIGIFGIRNQGKSSLINKIAGQEIAIVSEHPGTTTDPVRKSIEIPGLGPVVLIDTAGADDSGEVGLKRIDKSIEAIKHVDLAILVISDNQISKTDIFLIDKFRQNDVNFLIVHNKSDLIPLEKEFASKIEKEYSVDVIAVSCTDASDISILVAKIRKNIPESAWKNNSMIGDLVSYGDIVLLITPIDIEAPEGRLILPQVQAIRDILDNDAIAIVLKERELDTFLKTTGIKPKLVITDSQILLKAAASVPDDIPLTGFSILLARYKGDFEAYLQGTPKISELKSGDKILMLESCTHLVSCDDIGRVKLPRWISNFTGKDLHFDFVAGLDKLQTPIEEYALVIQCGGCVVTKKQIMNRLSPAKKADIPITNYGMAIAYVQGVYKRAIAPFTGGKTDSLDYL
jgi:[FeFe] hydrogenase H-cluster maturation GTPase HydF